MFICNQCLTNNYTNQSNGIVSYGSCELCNKTKHCFDIPSRYLTSRLKSREEIGRDKIREIIIPD